MRRLVWTAYLVMACQGYLVYAVGFITPFIRHDLGVAPWLAAMPNSGMAIGMGIGGALARGLNARFGPTRAIRAWIVVMASGGVLLATPLSIVVVILGGLVFGMACGGMLVHVNSALGQGPTGAMMLTRANLSSMAGGLAGPLMLSAAAASIGWWFGSLAPVPVLLALAFVTPGSPARDLPVDAGAAEPPLPRSFWLAWAFLTLCIGAEFCYVVWGSQVVAARTGITVEAATGLAALYVVGMATGRLLASLVHVAPRRQLLVLRGGTGVTLAGAVVLWVAGDPALAGLGLFLGGFGMAPVYPFAASLALAHAPFAPVRASARLTLASSLSIFVAPLALGVVVGITGVTAAWAIAPAILVIALVLIARSGVPPSTAPRPELLTG